MTIVGKGLGRGPNTGGGNDTITQGELQLLRFSQSNSLNKVLNLSALSAIDLGQFATVSIFGAGSGVDIFSVCVSHRLNFGQAPVVSKVLNLFADDLIQLRHQSCLSLFKPATVTTPQQQINDKGIVNRNVSRRINQTLYSLKRLWGGSFSIYKTGDATVDVVTGTQSEPVQVTHIRRGIILPGKVTRDIKQTISMISANKAFVSGGTYDRTARTFIVDREDAPDLDLTVSDYIIYENKRYEVKEFQEFEFDSAWVIAGQAIEGEIPQQVRLLSADNLIRLEHSATGEI